MAREVRRGMRERRQSYMVFVDGVFAGLNCVVVVKDMKTEQGSSGWASSLYIDRSHDQL